MKGTEGYRLKAKRRMRIALFIVGILFIWAAYIGWQQEKLIQAQRKTMAEVSKSLDQEKETRRDLQYQAERLKDPEYIANLARSKYYMSKKGEVIFEIIGDERNETK